MDPLKIIKLLQLSQSPNDHEALSAIRKVNELVRHDNGSWERFFKNSNTSNLNYSTNHRYESMRWQSEREELTRSLSNNRQIINQLQQENASLKQELAAAKANPHHRLQTPPIEGDDAIWLDEWKNLSPEEQSKHVDLACAVANPPYDQLCCSIRDSFRRSNRLTDKQALCIMRSIKFNKFKEERRKNL